jgi:hypothetical protein
MMGYFGRRGRNTKSLTLFGMTGFLGRRKEYKVPHFVRNDGLWGEGKGIQDFSLIVLRSETKE